MTMLRTFIASPLSGDTARNQRYATACMRDSLMRGESPYAPHLLLTQALRDDVPEERAMGMKAALAMLAGCDVLAVYEDLGVSSGMAGEISRAEALGIPVERRRIGWVEAEAAAREGRCNRCGWPLRERVEDGCTPGNCSMRPLPPERWPVKGS